MNDDASRENETPVASTEAMGRFWDAKARENAMYFIHSCLDYNDPDEAEFWQSGAEALRLTLAPFGRHLSRTDRVLEIGCGIGRMTRAIAAQAGSVVGVDVSAEMIATAQQTLADLGNATAVVGTGTDLSGFANTSFDVCYSFIVFQHIPDPAVTCHYVVEIGRVLRPGGWAVFQVSELPELHQAATHDTPQGIVQRLRRVVGRAPRGCLAPQWLGSAVARRDLLAAIDKGGLELAATTGDGTQFCMVHVTRPA